jgi:hypothetical protein
MQVDLARLLAHDGVVLAEAATADEFEGEQKLAEADRHFRSQ